jgi:alkanesulfonate monooxygenase SsuD/methylene tetrahydromethanopterin reductase-like flavin-dependent oxidoreductase (luciferase family)
MIGTQQEGVAVHLIKGQISRQWVIDFTRLHEQWNYDYVLVGYYASAAEGFAIALYAADHTERIKFLIAHRPGSVAPALAARQVATFDQLTQGRMALHIIAGTSDASASSEGDFCKDDATPAPTHTERIKFLIAHRPGSVAPALARGSRDLRPAHARADGAAYHRRHQRRGPGQRRRLPAQERPLPPRRRISGT